MTIFDLIRGWDLHLNPATPPRLSRREMDLVFEGADRLYTEGAPAATLGRVNIGIHDSLQALDNAQRDVRDLALPLLLFDQVWVPDPMYSALSRVGAEAWARMPDSGSTYYKDTPTIHTQWKTVREDSPSARKDRLRELVQTVVPRLMRLEPLVASGAVVIYPWEKLMLANDANIRAGLALLENRDLPREVKARYKQHDFTLGVRLGAMGVAAGDKPPPGMRPGEPMWFGDHTPEFVYGLTNAFLNHDLGCVYSPKLGGDRVVHDYLRNGCAVPQEVVALGKHVHLPDFEKATWPDIVAIRSDSVLLSELRGVVRAAADISDRAGADAVAARVDELSARFQESARIWPTMRPGAIDFALGAFGGGIAAVTTGSPFVAAAVATGVGALPPFLRGLASAAFGDESREKRARAELVTRIASRLSR